jgi:hypothetical protein
LRSFGELRGWPQDDSDGISIDSPGAGRPAPDFSNQVHDFDPGLDNGLFWTVPLDKNSVKVDPGKRIKMRKRNRDSSSLRPPAAGQLLGMTFKKVCHLFKLLLPEKFVRIHFGL